MSPDVFVADIDLDDTLLHFDFNDGVQQLVQDHAGDVELKRMPAVAAAGQGYCAEEGKCYEQGDILFESSFHYLSRTDAGYAKNISVRALMKDPKYGLRSLRDYQIDARAAINAQRQSGTAPNARDQAVARDDAGRPVMMVDGEEE